MRRNQQIWQSLSASISVNTSPIIPKIDCARKPITSAPVSFNGRLNRPHIDRDRSTQRYVETNRTD
eukprot:scaffold7473_cov141-Skeletonema_marinoi.AAC.13